MKHFTRFLAFLLLASIAILFSCQKEIQAPVNANTSGGTGGNGGSSGGGKSDTCGPPSVIYTGQEFIFDTTWLLYTDISGDEIYCVVFSSNSFSASAMSGQKEEVSIKLDSSSNWIPVPKWDWYPSTPFPTGANYFWSFPSYPYCKSNIFVIDNWPLNYKLVGKPVQVKVKF